MYSAKVFMTRGMGLEINEVRANDYKEFMNKIEKVEGLNGKEIKLLGFDTKIVIEKIVFNYPSGKKFIKKF